MFVGGFGHVILHLISLPLSENLAAVILQWAVYQLLRTDGTQMLREFATRDAFAFFASVRTVDWIA